nr:retrotransposon protein, putative, Ty3-gypsy subclass [Tanacetum cinerariifolium]
MWKWDNITMDFVTKLPKTLKKHDAILVIVDRLTKNAHFLPIRETFSIENLVELYINEIVTRHGVPVIIVLDRDGRFTSIFWRRFQQELGSRLTMKVGKRELASTYVIQTMTDKIDFIRERLKEAQSRQKSYADRRRRPIEVRVGDFMMLKVSPWKGIIWFCKRGKLSPRFIGPLKFLARVGAVAYRLELPEKMNGTHNTFHVSYLRKCLDDETTFVSMDEVVVDDKLNYVKEPEMIIDQKKLINKRELHKREYDSWKNERQIQTIEEKVDTSNSLDASLVDTESSGIELKEQDTSNKSRNDAHTDDADIKPIYDKEPMAEVETDGKIFKTVGLRWIPTRRIFKSSKTKIDSEPPYGSNTDITNLQECLKTLYSSADCTSNPNDKGKCAHKFYTLSWKPCQGGSSKLNLPVHRNKRWCCRLIPAESDSLPHAHAQTTKTYYKHQDSRINKAQELKTKTSATSDIKDTSSETKIQRRLLASFQNDAKYEHVGEDTRSQYGKDNKDKQGKDIKISESKAKSKDNDKG